MKQLLISVLMFVIFTVNAAADEGKPTPTAAAPFGVGDQVLAVLQTYCFSCHNADEQNGEVRLDNLESLKLDARLDLLNRAHEQIFIGEMPPKNERQPTEAERNLLTDWISSELRAHNASKLEDKLRKPEYGNVVDHEKLFSGKYKDLPGYTPDRRWLMSEFIFNAKFNKLLDHVGQRDIDGKRYQPIGDNNRRTNLTNPFLLPTHSGVRYYDTTVLDGGHLLTMLTNAKEVSAFMLNRAKSKGYIPAIDSIMAPQWDHEKILATRESYLKMNIEQLLRDLYQEKHESLLPTFVATKYTPPAVAVGADGKPLKKPVFDTASPGNEELAQLWSAIRKHGHEGVASETLIAKCEQDWFHFGVNERTIQLRVAFMHGYMEDLIKKMPKVSPVTYKPPVDSELSAIREALLKHRQAGDTYTAIIAKCVAEWSANFQREREKTNTTDESISKLVDQLFVKIIERPPSPQELEEYSALTKTFFPKLGNEKAIERLIQTLILRTDFVYRQEFGEGEADGHGRKLLSPRDASYALAYALTDSSPDKELQEAAKNGKLNTREDYRREVERMLKVRSQYYIIDEAVEKVGSDSFTNIPIRKLRFFREFFGYPAMLSIFKDNKRFGGNYVNTAGALVSEADMLVELILKEDQNVFERLLTTEEFYVYHSGDNAAMTASTELIRKIYDYFKDLDWQNFDADMLKTHIPFLKANPMPGLNLDVIGKPGGRSDQVKIFKSMMTNYTKRLTTEQTVTAPFSSVFGVPSAARTRTGKNLGGAEVAKAFNIDMISWNYPTTQPAKMENRKGILTHPAWLIAFAGNTATDPIRRGKWVREKLLAGTIPDVPVTVDAVIPEDHHKTLRQRLDKVTQAEYCWKCHQRMNPLGTAFEMYDDFGRFRTEEALEHPDNLIKKMPDKGAPEDDLRDIYKTLPVNATGKLVGTGDPQLDGEVENAIDLTERLAKSTKVRQSIIRHAFRYFLGRNEVLSDSKTLIDADQAYVQSGGSFDAVIVSLLTSDSFIYRKSPGN
jgi:mono/diheme cytochrome c family protein